MAPLHYNIRLSQLKNDSFEIVFGICNWSLLLGGMLGLDDGIIGDRHASSWFVICIGGIGLSGLRLLARSY